jgi:NMD protein affecting ribosome stability and mRNA decay
MKNRPTGICVICGKEYSLKRIIKHSSTKQIKGICSDCSKEKRKNVSRT